MFHIHQSKWKDLSNASPNNLGSSGGYEPIGPGNVF
jgi:hypothetical protein